jgi:hypothetical protein
MNIHLERVRCKANAPRRKSTDDVASVQAHDEIAAELQCSETRCFNDRQIDSVRLAIDIPEEELNEHYNPLRILRGEGYRR